MTTKWKTPAESIMERLFDCLARRDAVGAAACYASDAVVHDPSYPEPLHGRDAVRKDWEASIAAFSEFRMELREVLTRDNAFAAESRATGIHTGSLEDLAGEITEPTNRRLDIHGVRMGHLNAEGLIAEERRYVDNLTIMRQLGLLGT